ncbi:MAG: type III-B CRISPR module-associated protein Cmr5 [Peptococcaceae bacterium]|nr:MAG: type III-B CRISPR module-associated protein Cmr5 [Peptococcaceae bacterium]
MNNSLEQERAKFALEKIKDWGEKGSEEYYRYIAQLPVMIRNNGLGQSLVFLLAKKKAPCKEIYDAINEWLVNKRKVCKNVGNDNKISLIELLINGDRVQYSHAQQETLAFFNWLKMFADAFLKRENE